MAIFGKSTILYISLFLAVVAVYLSTAATAQDAAQAPLPEKVAGDGSHIVTSYLLTFSPIFFYLFTILFH